MRHTIGLAARDIKKGEYIRYSPFENTEDIIIKVRDTVLKMENDEEF